MSNALGKSGHGRAGRQKPGQQARAMANAPPLDADVLSLAERLQPLLKPARGFAPKTTHICAAILMAEMERCHHKKHADVFLACLRAHAIEWPSSPGV